MRQIPFVVFRLSFPFNIVTLWSVTLGLFLFDKQTNHFAFIPPGAAKEKRIQTSSKKNDDKMLQHL
jgi:hypothetical protein